MHTVSVRLGKILHSLHGGYNTFTALEFDLSQTGPNVFDLAYKFPNSRTHLLHHFEKMVIDYWGKDILIAAYISELFHFTCLIAHHLNIKKEALGFYLRTLELINNHSTEAIGE